MIILPGLAPLYIFFFSSENVNYYVVTVFEPIWEMRAALAEQAAYVIFFFLSDWRP